MTRQAYYQSFQENEFIAIEEELILKEVLKIRKNHPRIGTRKLYIMMEEFMLSHQIKYGRDALFDLLARHCLLIRKSKKYIQTTMSRHWMKKYKNLIKNFTPMSPNQLYVSDITYWKIESTFVYISLITDAYSHKIVGYHVAETMEAIETVQALKMALTHLNKGTQLIHHSDRGLQYCSEAYVKLLRNYEIEISMTESGDPLDNAIAERVNGILKDEYLNVYHIKNIVEAKELLKHVVKCYNDERPHMSNGNIAPQKVHSEEIPKGKKAWKNYYKSKAVN